MELIDHDQRCQRHELIAECFYDFDVEQILALPLPKFYRKDNFCYQGTRNGDYQVKSAYQMIRSWEKVDLEMSDS